MQSISFRKLRFLIIAAMICAEALGLMHYWTSEMWAVFLLLSFVSTTAMTGLLWSQSLGVPPGSIAFYLFLLAPTSPHSQQSGRNETVLDLGFAGIVIAILIWETLENRKSKKKALNEKSYKSEQPLTSVFGLLGPLGSLAFAALLVLEVFDVFVLSGDHSLFWFGPILPPFCWYLLNYIRLRKAQKLLNSSENLSVLQ